ncbi:hypothetical protein [Streptomyces sp. CBMAI 2042]|uniref:hypothetical protein n=1 Tax=Streptomyces sp. CBMAI 2042 TaxID=2305222 RepID=UPI001F20A852|nr:hypothetical protein [Streptomyces sp. CBMAI 2042]
MNADLLVAPVTITPTKPLTPTHIKGLIWTDLMVKATKQLTDVRLVWNNRMATVTVQSAAFWRHLDRTEPGVDWSSESEERIGELYVRFHAEPREPEPMAIREYLARADEAGWIHPAGRRILSLWRRQLDLLGVDCPGLDDDRPLAMPARSLVQALAERDLLLDHRRFGGPVYLDGTRWGLPLRRLLGGDGIPNYLLPILRELVPMIRPGRTFLLVHDDGITADYVLLACVLAVFGARVARVPLSRVSVDGKNLSSRYGGWKGVTLGDISAAPGTAGLDAYRLGMRLYFAGTLHQESAQSFRLELLRRCVGRAAGLLGRAPSGSDAPTGPQVAAALSRLRVGCGYVDPYRLMTAVQGKQALPLASVLRTICT